MNLFMNKSLMLLIGLLIISRMIGLPTNFSPMLAVAIFMPRLTNRKSIQSFLPAGVMLLTSIFLPPVDFLILSCKFQSNTETLLQMAKHLFLVSLRYYVDNNKKKIFSNLESLKIWLKNYFFCNPKI